MKKILLVLFLYTALNASDNMGSEYFFTFLPSWVEKNYPDENKYNIYVTSTYDTEVTVEIEALNFKQTQHLMKNGVVSFSLSMDEGQCLFKLPSDPPLPDSIIKNKAIHLYSDKPVTAYAISRASYTTDGALLIPVKNLGLDYIVSSYESLPSIYEYSHANSELSVIGTEDSTLVTIIIGGNEHTITSENLKFGDTTSAYINKGDIWFMSGYSKKSDLTGSRIKSDKPVSLLTGHFCANIPVNVGACDCLFEMEIPTNNWGKFIPVPKVAFRKRNPIIKVFAKEPNTKIFRDGSQIAVIEEINGKEGESFLHIRSASGKPKASLISGDKPISVTLFSPGYGDDNVEGDPYQMILSPIIQYHKNIAFTTPGIYGVEGFDNNYLYLFYLYGEGDMLDESFEIGRIDNSGEIYWQKIGDMYNYKIDDVLEFKNNLIYQKTIELPVDGVYYLRSEKPFMSYSTGSSKYDSYGYPTGLILNNYNDMNHNLTIYFENESAYAGDIINIPVKIKNNEGTGIAHGQEIDFDVKFNQTLLSPVDYEFSVEDVNTSVIHMKGVKIDSLKPEVLVNIRFIVGLGNQRKCDLSISNTKIYPYAEISSENGVFNLLGVCEEGGERLLNPYSTVQISSIRPNPANEIINFEVNLTEYGETKIYLLDPTGNTVVTFLSEIINDPGILSFTLDVSDYASGAYFVVLETPTVKYSRRFIIKK